MATVLGLPLIIDDEEIMDPVTIRHDPRQPDHPLQVQRDYYRPVNVQHGPKAGVGMDPAFGAYFPTPKEATATPAAAIAATVSPVAGLGLGPLAAAGLGLGTIALVATAYVAVLGGTGYWIGSKLAPSKKESDTYKWAGAVSNVVLPGIGLAALAGLAAVSGKDDD